jgi:hypothetical protein
VYLLVFHAYINEMHCSRSKIPSKNSRPYIYDVKFLALLGAPYIYDISRLRVNISGRSDGSASNRNEYQEYFLEGKGGRCIGLPTLPPSCAECLEVLRASPSCSPNSLPRHVMQQLLPIYSYDFQLVSFLQVSLWTPCNHFSSPHTCHMIRPSHIP